MFIVTDPNGNKISALDTDTDILKKKSRENSLICPDCKGHMIFRAGQVRIKHFSHKIPCDFPYHEPESIEHLNGKLILKKHFENLYPDARVELEYIVAETNQRSDIMILHPNGDRWAIEFQCSKISGDVWTERRALYDDANVTDIWIFGESVHSYGMSNRTVDKNKHRLCYMEEEKSSCTSGNYYLNTETNEVRFLLGVRSRWLTDTVIYNEEIIANVTDVFIHDNDLATEQTLLLISEFEEKIKMKNEKDRLREIEYKKIFSGDIDEYEEEPNGANLDEQRRNRARKHIKLIANERQSVFKLMNETELREYKSLCFTHGYNKSNFPSIFHVNFDNCDLIKTSRFLWQLWIYDKYIFNKMGENIYIPNVVDGFLQKINDGEFRLGEIYKDRHYSFAIYDYFTYLSGFGVTEQLSFKNSKCQKIIGDKVPIYEDVIKNSLIAVAIEDKYRHIPEINQARSGFKLDISELNADSYNKSVEDAKNNKNKITNALSHMIPIIKAKRELVNDWEYDFLNKLEWDLKRKRDISFSYKQKTLLLKVKGKIEKELNVPLEVFVSNQKKLQDETFILIQKKLFDEVYAPNQKKLLEKNKEKNIEIKQQQHIISSELIRKGAFETGYNIIKEKLERCRSSEKLCNYPSFQSHIDACDSILEKIEKKEVTKDDYDSLLVKVNNMSIPLLGE